MWSLSGIPSSGVQIKFSRDECSETNEEASYHSQIRWNFFLLLPSVQSLLRHFALPKRERGRKAGWKSGRKLKTSSASFFSFSHTFGEFKPSYALVKWKKLIVEYTLKLHIIKEFPISTWDCAGAFNVKIKLGLGEYVSVSLCALLVPYKSSGRNARKRERERGKSNSVCAFSYIQQLHFPEWKSGTFGGDGAKEWEEHVQRDGALDRDININYPLLH